MVASLTWKRAASSFDTFAWAARCTAPERSATRHSRRRDLARTAVNSYQSTGYRRRNGAPGLATCDRGLGTVNRELLTLPPPSGRGSSIRARAHQQLEL